MSPQRRQAVQDSWHRLRPMGPMVAELFYARLFELDPTLRPLFRSDIVAQGAKLVEALDFVVTGLDDWHRRLPAVQALARRHVGYGVQAAHYDTVGQALLDTLRQGLAADATAELMADWAAVYGTVAAAMKRAAWPQPDAATEWVAQAG